MRGSWDEPTSDLQVDSYDINAILRTVRLGSMAQKRRKRGSARVTQVRPQKPVTRNTLSEPREGGITVKLASAWPFRSKGRSAFKALKVTWSLFASFITIIALPSFYYQFYPGIEISGPPPNADTLRDIEAIIRSKNFGSIYNVSISCILIVAKSEGIIADELTYTANKFLPELPKNAAATLSCPFPVAMGRLTEAHVTIRVSYNYSMLLFPGEASQGFMFRRNWGWRPVAP